MHSFILNTLGIHKHTDVFLKLDFIVHGENNLCTVLILNIFYCLVFCIRDKIIPCINLLLK